VIDGTNAIYLISALLVDVLFLTTFMKDRHQKLNNQSVQKSYIMYGLASH